MQPQEPNRNRNPIVAVPEVVVKVRYAHPRNYRRSKLPRDIQGIVMHCTDGHEGYRKDDDVAAMFQRNNLVKRRSCHYVVDSDSATCCVPDFSIAWHCGHTGNARFIGVELCGRARQTRAQWLDELSLPMLCIAARLVADLCLRHNVPAVYVDPEGLQLRRRGITTHEAIGAAWRQTTHTDPGPHFPLRAFVAAVAAAMPPAPCALV